MDSLARAREVILGLSWIPLHLRHDVIRNLEPVLATAIDEARLEEATWWCDWFFGKPQSGKLGLDRLEEGRERIAELEASLRGPSVTDKQGEAGHSEFICKERSIDCMKHHFTMGYEASLRERGKV